MWQRIYRKLARDNFALVNAHRYDEVVAQCVPDVRHRFGGEHALSGTRNDREHLRAWFARLGRLNPELRLVVHDVWVAGWPHAATVTVRWTGTMPLPDGSTYHSRGVHVIRTRLGKVVEIDANEDSQAVAAMLRLLVEHGVGEAGAEPIVS
jgi:ketosteroid isomerase-like protein